MKKLLGLFLIIAGCFTIFSAQSMLGMIAAPVVLSQAVFASVPSGQSLYEEFMVFDDGIPTSPFLGGSAGQNFGGLGDMAESYFGNIQLSEAEIQAFYDLVDAGYTAEIVPEWQLKLMLQSNRQALSPAYIHTSGYVGPASFVCAPLIVGDSYRTVAYGADKGADAHGHEFYDHTGIDFGVNGQNGLPVISPIGGEVVYAAPNGSWGLSVIIENDGYQVLLGHASQVNVVPGQIVEAGDVVMSTGGGTGDPIRDGNSSGAHVHFETRYCLSGEGGQNECWTENPNLLTLPGQTEACLWDVQITEPQKNWEVGSGNNTFDGVNNNAAPDPPGLLIK
jgi:murein DD-endopeptidase MepM/ murein hydrolase activator NlpD